MVKPLPDSRLGHLPGEKPNTGGFKGFVAHDSALAELRKAIAGAPTLASRDLPTRAQADAYAVEIAKRWLAACDAGAVRSTEGKYMAQALIDFHVYASTPRRSA